MKSVFIITEIKIYKGNSAGAARMMNMVKALAIEGVKVYLCSMSFRDNISIDELQEVYPNIFLVGEERKKRIGKLKRKLYNSVNVIFVARYLQRITKLATLVDGEKIFYLYPTTKVSMDFIALIMVKTFYRYKLFCDINELRRAILHNIIFSKNIIALIYQLINYPLLFIKYYIVELLTIFYDGIICISTNIERYFKKYNNKTLRVPILSDILGYSFNPGIDYKRSENFQIGFAGSISLRKEGFDDFYKTLSFVKLKFDRIQLHLYGPISKNEKKLILSELPEKYKIKENIIYHGIINQDMLMNEIRKCHLLVLPRPLTPQTKHGFSTKLSQYLVSGVPILVTDVSDNSLYIKDGYNGFIVEPGDYKKMAKKIIYIISNYNSIKDIISKNAYLTAKRYFNYVNYGEKISNFLFEEDRTI